MPSHSLLVIEVVLFAFSDKPIVEETLIESGFYSRFLEVGMLNG